MAMCPISSLQDGRDICATGVKDTIIKMPTEGITIGTWNVCILYACGRIQELTHELKPYHWDIIGLSEVWCTGLSET